MKTFLVIFRCAENSKSHEAWKRLDPKTQNERMEKGMAAKQHWTEKYKDRIVLDGGALDKTKRVDSQGIQDIPSQMGAFMIVKADSHEEAASMFLNHPHFACFPGDAVEIIERTDIPRGE